MVEENRCAIAQVVLFGREQIALLRPFNRLIVMNTLHFENQVKEPSAFHDELTTPELSTEEMKLAKMLIKASIVERFELAKYKDTYVEKLTAIIEAKVAGQEIVAAPQAEVPKVINLMEALKKSVAEATRKGAVKKEARRKMAPSAPLRSAEKRKKKSS
jgi:DNA end-binding protein Ku